VKKDVIVLDDDTSHMGTDVSKLYYVISYHLCPHTNWPIVKWLVTLPHPTWHDTDNK